MDAFQRSLPFNDFGCFCLAAAALEPFMDGFGDHVLRGHVVFAGGVKEMVKLVQWQSDLSGGQNLFSGPFGDFFGAVFGGFPACDSAEVDDATELFGELPQGKIVVGAPVAKL